MLNSNEAEIGGLFYLGIKDLPKDAALEEIKKAIELGERIKLEDPVEGQNHIDEAESARRILNDGIEN